MAHRQQGSPSGPSNRPENRAASTASAATSGSKAERILAYMVASTIGLSILAFFAIILATLFGMDSAAFATGAWPVIALLPLLGLPLGFVMMISLIVLSLRRRSREAAALAGAPTRRPKAR